MNFQEIQTKAKAEWEALEKSQKTPYHYRYRHLRSCIRCFCRA